MQILQGLLMLSSVPQQGIPSCSVGPHLRKCGHVLTLFDVPGQRSTLIFIIGLRFRPSATM